MWRQKGYPFYYRPFNFHSVAKVRVFIEYARGVFLAFSPNLPDALRGGNATCKPEGFEGELFRLLFDSAEIAKFTPQEKIKYEYDMTTERDIRNQIAYAHDKGVEEGIEQGIEQGIERGIEQGIQSERSRIEENLRKKGMSDEEITNLLRN